MTLVIEIAISVLSLIFIQQTLSYSSVSTMVSMSFSGKYNMILLLWWNSPNNVLAISSVLTFVISGNKDWKYNFFFSHPHPPKKKWNRILEKYATNFLNLIRNIFWYRYRGFE